MSRVAHDDDLYRGAKNTLFVQDGAVRSDAYVRRGPFTDRNGVAQDGDANGLSVGFAAKESVADFSSRTGYFSRRGVIGIPEGSVTALALGIENSKHNALHGNIVGLPYDALTPEMTPKQAAQVNPAIAQELARLLAEASDLLTE